MKLSNVLELVNKCQGAGRHVARFFNDGSGRICKSTSNMDGETIGLAVSYNGVSLSWSGWHNFHEVIESAFGTKKTNPFVEFE